MHTDDKNVQHTHAMQHTHAHYTKTQNTIKDSEKLKMSSKKSSDVEADTLHNPCIHNLAANLEPSAFLQRLACHVKIIDAS